jgi:hypothetical protein
MTDCFFLLYSSVWIESVEHKSSLARWGERGSHEAFKTPLPHASEKKVVFRLTGTRISKPLPNPYANIIPLQTQPRATVTLTSSPSPFHYHPVTPLNTSQPQSSISSLRRTPDADRQRAPRGTISRSCAVPGFWV